MSNAREPRNLRPRPSRKSLSEIKKRYPGVDPSAAAPILKLINLGRAIATQVGLTLTDIGLTEARFTTVMMVLRMEWESGHATPSELAEHAGVGRAAMTQLLDGLEAIGWVERVQHPGDRRKLAVVLTAKAHQALDDFLPAHYRRLSQWLKGLSQADKKQLGRLLEKIEQGLDGE
jgi:DNA-binding MarR family transcriptional regulator